MNRFILDTDMTSSAQAMCDKHVVKMVLEEAQILSAACHINGIEDDMLYRLTHANHPIVRWTAHNQSNFDFGLQYFEAMHREFMHRFKKQHLSYTKLAKVFANALPEIKNGPITAYPICTHHSLKSSSDLEVVAECYREYYLKEKRDFAAWNNFREAPSWWTV